MDSKATIKINDREFEIEANDLQTIRTLGRGAYGIVDEVRHVPSDTILAVKVFIYYYTYMYLVYLFSLS